MINTIGLINAHVNNDKLALQALWPDGIDQTRTLVAELMQLNYMLACMVGSLSELTPEQVFDATIAYMDGEENV